MQQQVVGLDLLEDIVRASVRRGFWQVVNMWQTWICIIVCMRCSTYTLQETVEIMISPKALQIGGKTNADNIHAINTWLKCIPPSSSQIVIFKPFEPDSSSVRVSSNQAHAINN